MQKKERESKGARVYKIYFDMAQATSAVFLFSGAMLLAIVGGYYGWYSARYIFGCSRRENADVAVTIDEDSAEVGLLFPVPTEEKDGKLGR